MKLPSYNSAKYVDNIHPDTLGSYKTAKKTWGNAGTFAYDIYEEMIIWKQ